MEVLEAFTIQENHNQKLTELHLMKRSLEQQLQTAENEQSELRKTIDDLEQRGHSGGRNKTQQTDVQECLAAYKWLGVSIKSFDDNLRIQFNPAFRGHLSPEYFVVEVELKKDSFNIVQHSLPLFVPLDKLSKENGSDLKALITSLSDYLYAYVQRQEALNLVKVSDRCPLGYLFSFVLINGIAAMSSYFQKQFLGYLSKDIEADLPVSYVHLNLLLQPSHGHTKLVEVELQYDITRVLPDNVEIKADITDMQLENWKSRFLNMDIDEALESVIG